MIVGNEAILTQGVILILLDYMAAGHYLAGNYFFSSSLDRN